MRLFFVVVFMVLGGHAIAACGNLCDYEWLDMATPTELKAELDTGADVMSRDEDGGTPLHAAVQTDNPEITKIFLNAGANVNARNENGTSPLHWVHSRKHIQVLLNAGADVNARDENGRTPLHYFAFSGSNAEMIKALINAGANVNARSSIGYTPLHEAATCYICTTGAIEALLEAGGDPRATTKFNDTPWDFAKKNETLKGTTSYWALNDARYN